MAKKKQREKPGPKPSALGLKSVRRVFLCRPTYDAWLEKRLAGKRQAFPTYFYSLIAKDAETDGVKPPPER